MPIRKSQELKINRADKTQWEAPEMVRVQFYQQFKGQGGNPGRGFYRIFYKGVVMYWIMTSLSGFEMPLPTDSEEVAHTHIFDISGEHMMPHSIEWRLLTLSLQSTYPFMPHTSNPSIIVPAGRREDTNDTWAPRVYPMDKTRAAFGAALGVRDPRIQVEGEEGFPEELLKVISIYIIPWITRRDLATDAFWPSN